VRIWLVVTVIVLAPHVARAQLMSPGPLSQAHANIDTDDDCKRCHESGNKVVAKLCFACHKDLDAEISAGRGLHGKQYKAKPCEECHVEHVGKTAKLVRWPGGAADKLDHALTGYPLEQAHAKVSPCAKCHTKTSPLGKAQFLGTSTACNTCHKDPHAGKFTADCKRCHSLSEWKTFDRKAFDHQLARFPLTGKHVAVDCAKCHAKTKPQAQRFKNLAFDTCAACHPDSHKGEFTARKNGECAQCHTIVGFAPTTFGVAEHATTAYPLDGKHAATPCRACHKNPAPRLAWNLPAKQCADCHANPHGTQFAKEMSQGGCAKCHTALDWHQPNIDHSTWPLVGAHARTACAACHGEQKSGAQPAAYRGIPRTCEGCHDDIHAGQFTQTQPVKACTTCHDATTFKIGKTFDHAKTRYPLDGKHIGLACDKCHTSAALRNGATSVRWRLGYIECRDCHANPHREQRR
jgi:hypothetical protein